MKFKYAFVLSILFTSSLVSCDSFNTTSEVERQISKIELVKDQFYISDSNKKLEIKVTYDDNKYVIINVTEDMIDSNIDYNSVGEYEITITYQGITNTFKVSVTDYKTIKLNSSDYIDGISKYSTGNFVTYRKAYTTFQFYRAHKSLSTSLTSIFPKENYVNVDSLSGAVYNKTPIGGIVALEIEYKSSDGLKVKYGDNRQEMVEEILPSHSSMEAYTLEIDDSAYFSLETIDKTVIINSINIVYKDSAIDPNSAEYYSRVNEHEYRLNPVTYEGTLVSGESYVDVPIDVTYTNGTYTINETKRYTYYSYQDVASNPSLASKAAYTNPTDVANYFIAFKTYPANYVAKKSYSSAYSIFYENTRCVSSYNRTDGYSTSVPYKANSSGKPVYYECDIAMSNDYSSSERGVGRVVLYEYGFNVEGYDKSIVALYTDDHYASFSEYLNDGTWGERFNAEFNRTAHIYGAATTLS